MKKLHKQYFIFTIYTLVYTMFIVILKFIGGVVQTDKNTFDNQTDGKLLYPYHLTCTSLYNDF